MSVPEPVIEPVAACWPPETESVVVAFWRTSVPPLSVVTPLVGPERVSDPASTTLRLASSRTEITPPLTVPELLRVRAEMSPPLMSPATREPVTVMLPLVRAPAMFASDPKPVAPVPVRIVREIVPLPAAKFRLPPTPAPFRISPESERFASSTVTFAKLLRVSVALGLKLPKLSEPPVTVMEEVAREPAFNVPAETKVAPE